MTNFDICILCGLVATFTGVTFISMQYRLCMAQPHEWFIGTITGIVFFALCFVIYRIIRKDRY